MTSYRSPFGYPSLATRLNEQAWKYDVKPRKKRRKAKKKISDPPRHGRGR